MKLQLIMCVFLSRPAYFMGSRTLAKPYLDRRVHSLLGLWLVIYLIEHLLTNSQAALFIGDNGNGFVRMVNWLHGLPYLPVIEIVLLAFPIIAHGIWGVQYILSAKSNCYPGEKNKPRLPSYKKNHAYSWQRYTAIFLLVAIIFHVLQMRFIDYPISVKGGENKNYYMVRVSMDKGLYTVANRLQTVIYDKEKILNEVHQYKNYVRMNSQEMAIAYPTEANKYSQQEANVLDFQQTVDQYGNFLTALTRKELKSNQVICVSKNFGTAVLLNVRNTFKSPLMITLYTVFVLVAVYHAFNGLWTFCISWGINITPRSQQIMSRICIGLIVLLAFLGLAAIWGTYLINLKH